MTDEQIVEAIEFETPSPDLSGEMTITTTLRDSGGGTDVVMVHEGVPDGIPRSANEEGMRMALANLAALVEHPSR